MLYRIDISDVFAFEQSERLECFASVFDILSQYDDWRLLLSSVLQPVPFPDTVLTDPIFIKFVLTTLL